MGANLLPASAANVSDYADLSAAITAQDSVINFIGTPINWGTLLQVEANVTFNNQVSVPVTFSGNGSNASLLRIASNSVYFNAMLTTM